MEEIKKISDIEGLYMFYNNHLEKFLSHKINSILFSEMKPDDIVQVVVQPGNNPQMPGNPGIERRIKAKERLVVETKKRDEQEHILRVINNLIKKENA